MFGAVFADRGSLVHIKHLKIRLLVTRVYQVVGGGCQAGITKDAREVEYVHDAALRKYLDL
jgi:hypothetical protein